MFHSTQPLIYVVDDDHDEHCLLKTVFSRQYANCILRCLSDGTELVTRLTHCLDGRMPDLILLDWHMPLLGGHQVLQLLKEDAQWRSIPVVVRSSSERYDHINTSYDLGAKAFIMKSSNYQQFADSMMALPY
ncbi:MAG TPA: response regulator [Spirosoma sp.]|nr:response regulator [Spirosoma sp.]